MTPGERIVAAWDGWGADFSENLKVNLAKSIDEVIVAERAAGAKNADEVAESWSKLIDEITVKAIEEERAKVAAEREACAKIADKVAEHPDYDEAGYRTATAIAERIRARGTP